MDNPLRIVHLQAENVKRLKAVDIHPDPNVVIIGGRNGQGKTSVLDSIAWALGGKPDKGKTPRPVRDGQTEANVVVNLGELVVERTWRGDQSTLTVRSADGAKVMSPQAILDALTGEMAFDPLRFAQQAPKVQRDTLLSLVELPFDLEALEAERQAAYDQRTDINRALKAVEARIDAIPPIDVPADALSVADAMTLYRADDQVASSNREARAAFHRAEVAREAAFQRVEECIAALAVAQANVNEAHVALSDCVDIFMAQRTVFEALPPEPDLTASAERLRAAEHWSEMRAQAQRAIDLEAERVDLARQSEECSVFLDVCDQSKREGLAKAIMPIDGLGLADDGGGITYQGIPFSQASAAEQLRVAVAIAMAGDPRIRVVRIADGSLLDDDNLALISKLAEQHDFQVWIERVGDHDPTAIVIEDGEVIS